MGNCIFCDIVRGEAEASIVHEDEHALVILDLFPVREGHALVLPRDHHGLVGDLDTDTAAHLFELGRRVIRAQKAAGMEVDGHNLVLNDGPAANQHVPHVHLHVIPRRRGDTLRMAATWGSRMFSIFGLAGRRERLDRLAGLLHEHFPAA